MVALLATALLAAAPPVPRPWLLVVATEGGPTGRGKGGIEVRSTGELWVKPAVGAACQATLGTEEMRRMELALLQARPRDWKPRYVRADNRQGCCNQVINLVQLTSGAGARERSHATGWFDDARVLAPMDAQRLQAAGWALARSHPCKPRR